uniref:Uncharacterized protein n=1 Tax=Medicago truncatula TaxID=3880 RepID=Q2HVH6_MEDTR|nr:hypothetical protein MtrDRAFT_AC148819g8v2 [Medicago truncatula]
MSVRWIYKFFYGNWLYEWIQIQTYFHLKKHSAAIRNSSTRCCCGFPTAVDRLLL